MNVPLLFDAIEGRKSRLDEEGQSRENHAGGRTIVSAVSAVDDGLVIVAPWIIAGIWVTSVPRGYCDKSDMTLV